MAGLHDPTDEPVASETINYDWELGVAQVCVGVWVCGCVGVGVGGWVGGWIGACACACACVCVCVCACVCVS